MYRTSKPFLGSARLFLYLVIHVLSTTFLSDVEGTQASSSQSEFEEAQKTVGRFLRNGVGTTWLSDLAKRRSAPLTTADIVNELLRTTKPNGRVWRAASVLSEALKLQALEGLRPESIIGQSDNWKDIVAGVEKEDDIICLYRKNTEETSKKSEDWQKFLKMVSPGYTVHLAIDTGLKYVICLKRIDVPEMTTTELSNSTETTLSAGSTASVTEATSATSTLSTSAMAARPAVIPTSAMKTGSTSERSDFKSEEDHTCCDHEELEETEDNERTINDAEKDIDKENLKDAEKDIDNDNSKDAEEDVDNEGLKDVEENYSIDKSFEDEHMEEMEEMKDDLSREFEDYRGSSEKSRRGPIAPPTGLRRFNSMNSVRPSYPSSSASRGRGGFIAESSERDPQCGRPIIFVVQPGNLPMGNLPMGNLPMGILPMENVPVENVRMGNVPIGNVPMGNVPMGNVPTGNVPMGNVPIGNVPMGNVPMGNVPTGNVPMGNVPTGNVPMGNVPTGNGPMENVPMRNFPVGNFSAPPLRLPVHQSPVPPGLTSIPKTPAIVPGWPRRPFNPLRPANNYPRSTRTNNVGKPRQGFSTFTYKRLPPQNFSRYTNFGYKLPNEETRLGKSVEKPIFQKNRNTNPQVLHRESWGPRVVQRRPGVIMPRRPDRLPVSNIRNEALPIGRPWGSTQRLQEAKDIVIPRARVPDRSVLAWFHFLSRFEQERKKHQLRQLMINRLNSPSVYKLTPRVPIYKPIFNSAYSTPIQPSVVQFPRPWILTGYPVQGSPKVNRGLSVPLPVQPVQNIDGTNTWPINVLYHPPVNNFVEPRQSQSMTNAFTPVIQRSPIFQDTRGNGPCVKDPVDQPQRYPVACPSPCHIPIRLQIVIREPTKVSVLTEPGERVEIFGSGNPAMLHGSRSNTSRRRWRGDAGKADETIEPEVVEVERRMENGAKEETEKDKKNDDETFAIDDTSESDESESEEQSTTGSGNETTSDRIEEEDNAGQKSGERFLDETTIGTTSSLEANSTMSAITNSALIV